MLEILCQLIVIQVLLNFKFFKSIIYFCRNPNVQCNLFPYPFYVGAIARASDYTFKLSLFPLSPSHTILIAFCQINDLHCIQMKMENRLVLFLFGLVSIEQAMAEICFREIRDKSLKHIYICSINMTTYSQ